MDSKNWHKLKEIFSKALELEGREQESYIEGACGNDKELLSEVRSLLIAHEKPGPLDKSPEKLKQSLFTGFETQTFKGKQIGHYKIINELGHGGMGSVYMAERSDGQYDQRIALKLLRTGITSETQTRRFLAERQILATLVHKNIARLLDGGVTEHGQPWFAMEYIEGLPIDRYCDKNRLSLEERLKLFLDVCSTVQFAHRKLVVHRDLKPSNIFIENDGTVKLLDFGIAKTLKPDEILSGGQMPVTKTGLLPLTPAYASPEQVQGEEITTASDIYQLGVVLYELLTGNRPYDVSGKSPSEIEQIICNEKPTRPSTAVTSMAWEQMATAYRLRPTQLKKQLRGDLDTIVLKAMHKEPDRRYESSEKLATDIKHYLAGRPVTAHPDSRLYRTRKYITRHRFGVTAVAAVFLSLLIGIGVALWQTRKTTQALAETRQALGRAEALQSFLLDLFQAAEPDRPRDQLPDTEEILALGAKRAMNPDAAPPEERFEMLLTIAGVYTYHAQATQTETIPLLDEAIELARRNQTLRPEDLARALEHRAKHLIFNGGSLNEAEAQLLEAESLVKDLDHAWRIFAQIRITRTWKESFRGDPGQALELLEPLYEQMDQQNDIDPEIRAKIMDRLASLYRGAGNLEESSYFRTLAIEAFKQHYGLESREYTASLANSVAVEHELGRFDRAESRAREAIALYDRIYHEPRDYRASVRLALAETLFALGRFDEAFEELEKSSVEWASFMGQELENWRSHYIKRGYFYMRMHEIEKTFYDFTRVQELVDAQGGRDEYIGAAADVWLAWAVCRRGNYQRGKALLAQMKQRGGETFLGYPKSKAELHEARATCHFQSGELEKSLKEVESALTIYNIPGRLITLADRRILHARILAALNQPDQAARTLDKAEQNFLNLGLVDHPYLAKIEATRSEWLPKTTGNN